MPGHDVIVIGASTGGVEALSAIVRDLNEDLPAAVFVVLHVRPDSPSMLPAILNRAGNLPAAHAVDREPIRRGRIYVAPPGFQMYLRPGRIEVRRGPRENMLRPAADPLFRTAAHHYRQRVVGVVLSGALDDGTTGLQSVKHAGGVTIAQEPSDAACSGMPESAIANVDVDYVAPAAEIGGILKRLAGVADPGATVTGEVPLETAEESSRDEAIERTEALGPASGWTCPECSGALWEFRENESVHYRCRVGHAYTAESMLTAQNDSVERALWAALRALEERAALVRRLAEHARHRGHHTVATVFEARSQEITVDANAIHDLINNGRALEEVVADEG